MNKFTLSRRHLLRGMLGGTAIGIGLPWLEIFTGREAYANTGFPQRFGVFFWGNGNRPEYWNPTGEGIGDAWQLSEPLSALSRHKEQLSVLTGMMTKVPNIMPHTSGMVGFLTGQAAVGADSDWTVGGPTIDQLIAQEIGGETIYRSLVLGCKANDSISWNGPNSSNPPETDPYAFYERVFGPTFREPGEEGIVDPSLGYRRSALDAVMEDIQSLQNRLGTEDRIRLEQHLDGIREIETRLARLQEDPPVLDACYRPEEPSADYADIDGRPQFGPRNAVMAQMLAMALACDQTRVFSYEFTKQLNNYLFLDASEGHHTLTHNEGGDQPTVQAIASFVMEQFAHFLDPFKAIQEGDGTLLDNCAIVCTSEVSEGRTHSLSNIPLLIAGSAGGRLKTNLHYSSYSQENANKPILSVIRALGINQASHGADDTYTESGLSDIEV
ncbi:MAG: DUF1552 domain-containing protein [Myxococcota bacterium]